MPPIERDALLDKVHVHPDHNEQFKLGAHYVEMLIRNAPTIDPATHGTWLNFTGDFSTVECDKCGEVYEVSPDAEPCEEFFNAFKQFYKFCPSCGCKMEGDGDA